MTLTIYIDVLFFVNFIINSLLIICTGFILRYKMSIIRIAFGSTISAIYSVLMFFPAAHILYTISGRVIFTILFVMIYYQKYRFKELTKAVLAFVITSLIFFGFIYAYSMKNSIIGDKPEWLFSNGVPYADINIRFLLGTAALAYFFAFTYIKIADRNMSRSKIIYNTEIVFGEKSFNSKVLCDTGCELVEPLSGKPVILLSSIENININFDKIRSIAKEVRYVKASTISGDTDKLICLYKPDAVNISSADVCVDTRRCYVGFVDKIFTHDALYNGVANPDVFEDNKTKINFRRRTVQMIRKLKKRFYVEESNKNKVKIKIESLLSYLSKLFSKFKMSNVYYIGGTDTLPAPFSKEEEKYWINELSNPENANNAGRKLTEHNLRLVVYIAKKFDSTGIGIEDLISIGTIGLIKAINTFKPEKNIKLATYASRCIENEILMYLRKNGNGKNEVSIDEPLNVDWDGNELLLSDILGTDGDITQKNIEEETDKKLLKIAMDKLSGRERNIVELRFGINDSGEEKTQKEVADMLGISQSYISRLEKRIIGRLRRDMNRMING